MRGGREGRQRDTGRGGRWRRMQKRKSEKGGQKAGRKRGREHMRLVKKGPQENRRFSNFSPMKRIP